MVDKYTAFTYYDWDDATRPEIQIHPAPSGLVALLKIANITEIDITGSNRQNLKQQLEGYAEIFKAAADSLGEAE